MLLKAARARETGQLPGPGLARQACGDPGLALRLVETSTLTLDDRGSAQAGTWGGDALVVGYDDRRVSVWRPTETKHRDVDTVRAGPRLFLRNGYCDRRCCLGALGSRECTALALIFS